MQTQTFSIDDLMTLLVTKAGLPAQERTDDPDATFDDQGELQDRYGFELPDDRPGSYTFGQITAYVSDRLSNEGAA